MIEYDEKEQRLVLKFEITALLSQARQRICSLCTTS
jgi:hypothetical protein